MITNRKTITIVHAKIGDVLNLSFYKFRIFYFKRS